MSRSTLRERHLALVTRWLTPPEDCQAGDCTAAGHVHALAHQVADGHPGPPVRLLLGGRGSAKTTAGARWASAMLASRPHVDGLLLGPTHTDVRRTMIEGPSGLLAALPDGVVTNFDISDLLVTTAYGATIRGIGSSAVERARGPEAGWAWIDELAFLDGVHLPPDHPSSPWSTIIGSLRQGVSQHILATGTPRPVRLLRELVARAEDQAGSDTATTRIVVDHAPTWANPHLPESFREQARAQAGTALGRQEYAGRLITQAEGAAWSADLLAAVRIAPEQVPQLARVAVAVDPAAVGGTGRDATGILVGALGVDGLAYVLDDRSTQTSAEGWPEHAARAAADHGAGLLVVETNQGGRPLLRLAREALGAVGRDDVAVRGAWATSRTRGAPTRGMAASAKQARALATASRYGYLDDDARLVGGEVRHLAGRLGGLEDEALTFTAEAGFSPDRLDALHHLLNALLGSASGGRARVGVDDIRVTLISSVSEGGDESRSGARPRLPPGADN